MSAPAQESQVENDVMIEAINRSQAIIEFEVDGTIKEANENFLKIFGYTLDEVKGRHHSLFCEEDYTSSLDYKRFWDQLAKGEFSSGEYKLVGQKGREIWIIASYNPIMDGTGKVYKVVAFATDITEAKKELKIRTDIMNLTSIVSEANRKGDILCVNDKYIEVSKFSKDELIGQPHSITRHPDMPKEVFKEMWSTIGRGKIFRGIVKNRAKDGTPYYVDAVIAPFLGENGKPKKYLGVRYDITESEIERQNMKGVISAINSSFAYMEFDTSGNISAANDIFAKYLGFSEEELKGKHHRDFCDKENPSLCEDPQFWTELAEGKGRNGIFKKKTRSGEDLWIQAVYAPVTDEVGRVVKIIMIGTDVTDQQLMLASIQETVSSFSSLTEIATQMVKVAEKTREDSKSASVSAEEISVGVQTVATNIEEMVASINEIGRNTQESSLMAKTTMEKAEKSNVTISKLGVSSKEIGDVIKVISSIAQQTNLLALNATIEAARAGEAGKGFAVVANEVKELAKQTAKATDDITQKINAIQTDTQSAIQDIAEIGQSVEKLNSVSGVIAAAVEEQTATTNEISRVVVQSKKGVESIAEAIKQVSDSATESSASSAQTLEASKELALLAGKLTSLSKNNQ